MDDFDEKVNQAMLTSLRDRLKDKEQHESIDADLKAGVEVGFPNEVWFSDHIAVGAVLDLKEK